MKKSQTNISSTIFTNHRKKRNKGKGNYSLKFFSDYFFLPKIANKMIFSQWRRISSNNRLLYTRKKRFYCIHNTILQSLKLSRWILIEINSIINSVYIPPLPNLLMWSGVSWFLSFSPDKRYPGFSWFLYLTINSILIE